MHYDQFTPAEATATFTYQPMDCEITTRSRWDTKRGCFASPPEYFIAGVDVSWRLLDIANYKGLESKAMIKLAASQTTKEEYDKLVFDYMELTDATRAVASVAAGMGHDRAVTNAYTPGATYLSVGRNLKTGHWEWKPDAIDSESEYDATDAGCDAYHRAKDDHHA